MRSTAEHYLRDLGLLLKERALEAKRDFHGAEVGCGKEFKGGRYMAYYEVISLILSQAEAFGISARALAIEDLDPERDLLG